MRVRPTTLFTAALAVLLVTSGALTAADVPLAPLSTVHRLWGQLSPLWHALPFGALIFSVVSAGLLMPLRRHPRRYGMVPPRIKRLRD